MSTVAETAMRFLVTIALIAAALRASADPESDLRASLAGKHVELARQAMKEGLTEEALTECAAALALVPDQADAKAVMTQCGKPYVIGWDGGMHARYLAWSKKRDAMRHEAAGKWFALGGAAEKAGDAEGAKRLWRLATDFETDKADARKKLGEVKIESGWVSKEEADNRKKGLLEIGGQWLPAKDVLARRAKWEEAWEMKTAHFTVRTNASEADGRRLAARAEELLTAIRREIQGEAGPAPVDKPYVIFYFASREDMDAHIRDVHGDKAFLKQLTGFYSPQDDIGHFCPLPAGQINSLDDVVRHEATHQIVTRMFKAGIMNTKPGYWAWEGLAVYFESVEVKDRKVLTGNPQHLRFKTAKEALEKKETAPLEEFALWEQSKMGRGYEQAGSLVHYFLRAQNGALREKFVEFFGIEARGEADAGTFAKVFGKTPAQVQVDWAAWLKAMK